MVSDRDDIKEQYSLRGKIYNTLRENILNNKYKPGESLIETKLADELHVSRTPIREAIRQLELEGLVESIPNRGVYVKGISKKDMKDIYSIRLVLEVLAAKWSIENITDEGVSELKDIYELMEFYTGKGDIDRIAKLNTEFHQVIFNASKSNILIHLLNDFQLYVRWARHESLSMPGRMEKALEEHKNILEAFEKKDADEVVKALSTHIKNSSKNLFNKMADK
jgi:DNA-binding GntR family transcriptional regulator